MTNKFDKIILLMDEGFTTLVPERRKKLKIFLEQAYPNCAFYPIANSDELKALSVLEQETVRNNVGMVILGIYNIHQAELTERFGKTEIRYIAYTGGTQEYMGEVGKEIKKLNGQTIM